MHVLEIVALVGVDTSPYQRGSQQAKRAEGRDVAALRRRLEG